MPGIHFTAKTDTPFWLKMIRDKQRPVAFAAVGALFETANEIITEGRADIAASSPFFTSGWQKGLRYKMQGVSGEPSLQAKTFIFHKIGLAGLFENGAELSGKPLMWIPTERGGPPASRSGKKLVSATVGGTPVLFDANDRDRHRRPIYIGVPLAVHEKIWHITEITQQQVAQIALRFAARFNG